MKKKQYKSTPQKRAADHGRSFEYRVAGALPDAYVYTGKDGDVVWRNWIIECKYRLDFKLQKLVELGSIIEQAKRNAAYWARKGKPKDWAIFITGGFRTGIYVLIDKDRFVELNELADKYRELMNERNDGIQDSV